MPFISVHQSKLTRKKDTRKGLRLLAERKISYMNLQIICVIKSINKGTDEISQRPKHTPMRKMKRRNSGNYFNQ